MWQVLHCAHTALATCAPLPALRLQRPPSARLAARKKSGRSDSDWDEWEEERERPRKKKKPASIAASKGPVVPPGLANGLAAAHAAGMVPHQLIMGPNGQLTAVPAHMFAAQMAVSEQLRLPARLIQFKTFTNWARICAVHPARVACRCLCLPPASCCASPLGCPLRVCSFNRHFHRPSCLSASFVHSRRPAQAAVCTTLPLLSHSRCCL